MAKELEPSEFETILKNCSIVCFGEKTALENLKKLKYDYSQNELALIYSYILKNSNESKTIMNVLRQGFSGDSEIYVDTLIDILLSKNIDFEKEKSKDDLIIIRDMCAKAIGNNKNPKGVYPLLSCLNSKNENYKVRLSCAEALGKIGDKYAVSPLIDIVTDEKETSLYLKESATLALGMIGDEKVVDSLVGILNASKGLIDKFTFLKERVIEALAKINDKSDKVFHALQNSLLDESPLVRINAIEALMNLETTEAFNEIKKMLNDKDKEVAKNALIALYNLSDENFLLQIKEDENSSEFIKNYAEKLLQESENENE